MDIQEELFGIKKRTQRINSKRKGNVNELNLTKILAEWTGHEFARVPRSGGLRWRNRMDICGDVINVDPAFDFPFSVETKHVANLGISLNHPDNLRTNSVVFKYFRQCQRDADATNKIPILMIRNNGMKANTYYIFLSLNTPEYVKLYLYVRPVLHGMHIDDKYALVGFRSEEFFGLIRYEEFKTIMK